MPVRSLIGAAVLLLVCPLFARAQNNIYGGASLFEPEIDVVNSGILLDVQATVSHDRKYVTMTMRPQNAQLLALREFAFQTGSPVQGTAGGVNPAMGGAGGNGGGTGVAPGASPRTQPMNAPMRLAAGKGGLLLMQRGITPIVNRYGAAPPTASAPTRPTPVPGR